MKPAPFEYVAPESVEEALAALQQNNPDGKILAGGQSLLPLLNLRLTKPKLLVDLNGISGLDGIRESAIYVAGVGTPLDERVRSKR